MYCYEWSVRLDTYVQRFNNLISPFNFICAPLIASEFHLFLAALLSFKLNTPFLFRLFAGKSFDINYKHINPIT